MKKTIGTALLTAIVIMFSLITYNLLFTKVDTSQQSEIIIEILSTILGGIISGLVAYGVAKYQIDKEKESLREADFGRVKSVLELLKIEAEDNQNTILEGDIGRSDNMENEQKIFISSISSWYWDANSHEVDCIDTSLIKNLYAYYKDMNLIKNVNANILSQTMFSNFEEKQKKMIEEIDKFLSRKNSSS